VQGSGRIHGRRRVDRGRGVWYKRPVPSRRSTGHKEKGVMLRIQGGHVFDPGGPGEILAPVAAS